MAATAASAAAALPFPSIPELVGDVWKGEWYPAHCYKIPALSALNSIIAQVGSAPTGAAIADPATSPADLRQFQDHLGELAVAADSTQKQVVFFLQAVHSTSLTLQRQVTKRLAATERSLPSPKVGKKWFWKKSGAGATGGGGGAAAQMGAGVYQDAAEGEAGSGGFGGFVDPEARANQGLSSSSEDDAATSAGSPGQNQAWRRLYLRSRSYSSATAESILLQSPAPVAAAGASAAAAAHAAGSQGPGSRHWSSGAIPLSPTGISGGSMDASAAPLPPDHSHRATSMARDGAGGSLASQDFDYLARNLRLDLTPAQTPITTERGQRSRSPLGERVREARGVSGPGGSFKEQGRSQRDGQLPPLAVSPRPAAGPGSRSLLSPVGQERRGPGSNSGSGAAADYGRFIRSLSGRNEGLGSPGSEPLANSVHMGASPGSQASPSQRHVSPIRAISPIRQASPIRSRGAVRVEPAPLVSPRGGEQRQGGVGGGTGMSGQAGSSPPRGGDDAMASFSMMKAKAVALMGRSRSMRNSGGSSVGLGLGDGLSVTPPIMEEGAPDGRLLLSPTGFGGTEVVSPSGFPHGKFGAVQHQQPETTAGVPAKSPLRGSGATLAGTKLRKSRTVVERGGSASHLMGQPLPSTPRQQQGRRKSGHERLQEIMASVQHAWIGHSMGPFGDGGSGVSPLSASPVDTAAPAAVSSTGVSPVGGGGGGGGATWGRRKKEGQQNGSWSGDEGDAAADTVGVSMGCGGGGGGGVKGSGGHKSSVALSVSVSGDVSPLDSASLSSTPTGGFAARSRGAQLQQQQQQQPRSPMSPAKKAQEELLLELLRAKPPIRWSVVSKGGGTSPLGQPALDSGGGMDARR